MECLQNPIGKKAVLIKLYVDTPDPEQVVPWSDEQENELLKMKEEDINMKEADLEVSTNQMTRGVSNNIILLNTTDKRLHTVNTLITYTVGMVGEV